MFVRLEQIKLVQHLRKTSRILQLQEVQLYRHDMKQSGSSQRIIFDHMLALCKKLGAHGLRSLINLLVEHMSCMRCQEGIVIKRTIQIEISAYAASYTTHMTTSPTYEKSVFLQRTMERRLQRLAASPCVFGQTQKRLDVVVIEYNLDRFQGLPEVMFRIWFSSSSLFYKGFSKCRGNRSAGCKMPSKSLDCCSKEESELCFVQYSKVLITRI